jgi:hypothetical protein
MGNLLYIHYNCFLGGMVHDKDITIIVSIIRVYTPFGFIKKFKDDTINIFMYSVNSIPLFI